MMRYFYIKTIENIAIEGMETFAPIPDSDLIEVNALPIDFLFKKYLNGEWTTPDTFLIAILDEFGTVQETYDSFFVEDLPESHQVAPNDIELGWKFDSQTKLWVAPEPVEEETPVEEEPNA